MPYKYLKAEDYKKGVTAGRYQQPAGKAGSKRDRKFFLSVAEFIYGQYVSNQTLIGYGGVVGKGGRSIQELRDYARGCQPTSKYQNILDPSDANADEGLMNISWANVQIMPKFRDIVRGKLLAVKYEVITQAIDETANVDRLFLLNKMKLSVKSEMKAFTASTGVKPSESFGLHGMEQEEDIDFLNGMGGVRLAAEIMLKDAIDVTRYHSGIEVIESQNIDDLVDVGCAATHTYLEGSTNKILTEYVDVARLVARSSSYSDHRDSDYRGFIRTRTIADLRRDMERDGLTGEELENVLYKIAKDYANMHGNAGSAGAFGRWADQGTRKEYFTTNGFYPYDDFAVDELVYYVSTYDLERFVKGESKLGSSTYGQVSDDAQLSEKDIKKGKEIAENVVHYIYRGKWIVGTKYVYAFGKEAGVVRNGKNGVMVADHPIKIYSMDSPSMVERCVSHIDNIQLATLKKRNAYATTPTSPMRFVDKSLIRDSVEIGGKVYNLLQMTEMFQKTGLFVYESTGEWDANLETASNRKPIEFVSDTGIAQILQIFINEILQEIDYIRQVTGVNEVADGTSQNTEMLKGVMEGLSAATNNALKPLVDSLKVLQLNTYKHVAKKWQRAVLLGDVTAEMLPINSTILRTVTINKEIFKYDIGLTIRLMASEQERQKMLQDLMQKKDTGEVGLDVYYPIYNMILDGDLKKAQLYISRAVKKKSDEMHKKQMEVAQAQAKGNGESIKMANESEIAKIQAQTEMKLKLEERKAELTELQKQRDHDRAKELLQMQNAGKIAENVVSEGMKMGSEQSKSQAA